jgi:NADH:ubiquinone oxidoreductase subunit 2 (subunit N)
LVGLGALLSAVSLYYYLSVLKQAFVQTMPDQGSANPESLPLSHTLVILVPAALLVLLGLFPDLLLPAIKEAVISINGPMSR